MNGRIKLYVAASYRDQHGEWKEPLRDLIDEANGFLGPTFGLQLEISGLVPWQPSCEPSDLAGCLEELRALDAGGRDEWVVGVLGSLPRFVTSFDDLGRAHLPGRHFILRDVSNLAEREAIDRAFASMLPSRRDEIYRHRKHHKRLAAFLHEWAHTLGAEHSDQREGLLFPSYSDSASGYDEPNANLLAQALPARFAGGDESAPHEPAPSREHNAVARAPSESVAELSEADQRTYSEAESLARSEDPAGAYHALEPLVERYPTSHGVQQLACGLLMQLGRSDAVQTVCTRVMQLSAQP